MSEFDDGDPFIEDGQHVYFIGESETEHGGFQWGERSSERARETDDFSRYDVVVKTQPVVTKTRLVQYLRDLAEAIERDSHLPPENIDDELRRAGLL